MPQATNLTVKKADGTTDILWTLMNPAGGDGIPASFQSLTVGNFPAARPEIRVSGRSTKTGRALRITMQYPNVQTVGGQALASPGTVVSMEVQVKADQPTLDTTEAAAQFANLIKTPLIQSCLNSGYPPV